MVHANPVVTAANFVAFGRSRSQRFSKEHRNTYYYLFEVNELVLRSLEAMNGGSIVLKNEKY